MSFRSIRSSLTVLIFTACADACPEVREFQPNVPEGGRAFAIAVRPDNDKHLIVASETGGLFRSTNGGVEWDHLPFFPSHFVHDVSYASLAPQIVIATTRSRFLTVNDGGIWRSTDGGTTWSQPAGALPAPSRNCPSRPSANGLSFLPLSRVVYVATDCGLSRSADNGATWTNIILDPAAPMRTDSLQHRVWSVSVLTRTSGVAAADGGMFHIDGSGAWVRAATGPLAGKSRTFHAFAISPWSDKHYFHVGLGVTAERQMWMSIDGGANWTELAAPLAMNTREPFVRAARAVSGDDRTFDVYIGSGVDLFRQNFTHSAAGPTGSSWKKLTVDHSDPADVAFDIERRIPILLATDGGLHLTTDKGSNWKYTGGGPNGYNALQLTEVIGQEVTGSKPHLDLYYATQDNHIKASPDSGTTWPGVRSWEGFHLRIAPTTENHEISRLTGAACLGCSTFQSKEHLSAQAAWPNPPDGDTIPDNQEFNGTPMLIVEDAYLQATNHVDTPFVIPYLMTLSAGAAWSPAFTLNGRPRGPLAITGSKANPTVFQGFRMNGNLPLGGLPYGLTRVDKVATTPVIERADSVGMGALGVLKTMFAFYTVYGVDPNNADRLIAPDVRDQMMRYSRDGGRTWQPYPQLTSAVTDNGKFRFMVGDEPLASVIAFDPYDSCHIIVGTDQRGILRSTDGGTSWKVLKGSAGVTYPTSVYFPSRGRPIVSTYGRGLWKLLINRRDTDGKCAFAQPPRPVVVDTLIVLDPTTGAPRRLGGIADTSVCPRCDVIVVKQGWITGYQATGDSLTGVSISGGMIAQLNRAQREVPLAVPNAYELGEWRSQNRALIERLRPPVRARGLLVENGRLRGIIASVDELPVTLARDPMIDAHGAEARSTPGTVRAGDRLRIIGRGFVTTGASPPRILIDGRVTNERIAMRSDGTFVIDVPLRASTGEDVEIVAEQQDGRRLTRVHASVRVTPNEGT